MKFLFVFQSTLVGFFLGMLYGGITLEKGAGLAGGAIVFFDGLVGAFLALALSWWMCYRIALLHIKRLNLFLFLALLIPAGWISYKLINKQAHEPNNYETMPATAPAGSLMISQLSTTTSEMGLGLATPRYDSLAVFFFYSDHLFAQWDDRPAPVDSLVFGSNSQGDLDITYAPPWFAPEHLKFDYGVILFKVLAKSQQWALVEVNQYDGQTAWVALQDVGLKLWPDFLLNTYSVEPISTEANPLRVRHFDHAGLYNVPESDCVFQPILVRGDWLQVTILDEGSTALGQAWLRWRRNDELLVNYYLFS